MVSFTRTTDTYTTNIYLIRHGETTKGNVVLGKGSNPGLSTKGEGQARRAAQIFRDNDLTFTRTYSSKYARAVETGDIVAEVLGLEKAQEQVAFNEIDMGSSDGMALEDKRKKYQAKQKEILAKYPDRRERWLHPVVGESMASLHSRVITQLIVTADECQNQNALVFTHGKVIAAVLADCFDINEDLPLCRIDYCRVVHLQITNSSSGGYSIRIMDADWKRKERLSEGFIRSMINRGYYNRHSVRMSISFRSDLADRRSTPSISDRDEEPRKTSSTTTATGGTSSTTDLSAAHTVASSVGAGTSSAVEAEEQPMGEEGCVEREDSGSKPKECIIL